MDIEKAIDCLKADKEYLTDHKICDGEEMDIAIDALQKIADERSRIIDILKNYYDEVIDNQNRDFGYSALSDLISRIEK